MDMSNETQLPHFSTAGFLPNGAKVYFTIPIALDQTEFAYEIALQFTNTLLSKGFLLTEPGLEAGESKERIVTVMRRAKPSDDTPIIDMYPAWGQGGDEPYGTYKYLRVYLNTPEEIAEFLQVSGIPSLDAIPLYDAQMALKRTPNKRHAKEYPVPTPFDVIRHKPGKDKTNPDGTKIEASWELLRYGTSQNASKTTPASAKSNDLHPTGTNTPEASETPKKGDVRDFTFKGFTTKQDSNGKPYYSFETTGGQFGFYAFSRDPFRAVGIADETSEGWKKIGTKLKFEHTVSCVYTLRDGRQDGYWLLNPPKVETTPENIPF